MNLGKNLLQSVEERVSVASRSHQDATSNLAGELVSSITHNVSANSVAHEVEARVEVSKSIVSAGVQGTLSNVLSSTVSQLPIPTSGDSLLKQSIAIPPPSVEGAIGALESSLGNPTNQIRHVASSAIAGAAGEMERKALALMLARLRAIVTAYASGLPFVGAYFKQHSDEINVNTLITETTPLLGALRDPKAFATQQADGLLRQSLSPLLCRLPDIDALDNAEWGTGAYGSLFKALVECYVLAKDGSGWFFTHLQEHSLVIAPTVSLGHLSTTDLAASTVGTAVASVTGYSIIQGFISALDKLLATSPNHHVAKMHCARAAFVTGIALFPITNLWAVHSTALLKRFGQAPEVAGPAGEYLRIASAGLPGYALGEIAKRYLTSQGLSGVHTRMLSAIAPVNMALNYLLVNGPIPALRLGFAGAPLSTVLSHNALSAMLIVYIVQRAVREEVNYLRGRNSIDEEEVTAAGPSSASPQVPHDEPSAGFFSDIGSLLSSGVSGVSKSASQLWSKDFGGAVASMLGPNALATQAVLLTTATTLYQAPKAISSASSDRIKKLLAKGDIQRAKIATFVSFLGITGGAVVISTILLAYASSWGKLFNNDPVILESVSAILPLIAVFQAVHAMAAWADTSLAALGKTAVFPALNASADGFLGIPLGLYLAFPKGWGLAGMWAGLTVSLAYSCLMATIVLVRSNWKNAVSPKEGAAEGGIQVAAEPSSFSSLA